jgi:quinoprotein glucose dehydrogenase
MSRKHLGWIVAAGVLAGCGATTEPNGTQVEAAAEAGPAAAETAAVPRTVRDVEWRMYRGNLAAQNYSPLDQINRDNVGSLRVAWRWYAGNFGPRPEQRMESAYQNPRLHSIWIQAH